MKRLLPAAMLAALVLAATMAWGQCGPGGCNVPRRPQYQAPQAPQYALPSQPRRETPPAPQTVQAHPATCRIKNSHAGRGRTVMEYGSGTLVDKNERHGLVVTCQHLFRDGKGTVVCQFPEGSFTARVLATDPTYDLSMLLISAPDAEPVDVALTAPQRGDAVQGCGYGQDGTYRAVSGTVMGYVQTGNTGATETLQWSGGQRQGDSGGPVFDRSGKLVAVLWGTDNRRSVGTYAVRVDKFLLTAGRYLLPWNAKINDPSRDPRNQPPTIVQPPAVQPPAVNVDIGPLNQGLADTQARLDSAIVEVNANRAEIDAVKARQDNVAKIAGDLAEKYSEQLPGLSADVKAAIKDAADARAAAAAAKTGADAADSKASGMVGQVAAAASTAKDAIDKAEKVREGVDAALDPDVPTSKLGIAKAKILEKLEGTMIGKIAAAKGWAFAAAVLGVVAVVLGLIAVFVKKDIKDRKETGDPLLIEKLFSRLDSIAERTRNPVDDFVFDRAGNVVGRVADHIAPKPPAEVKP